MNSTECSSRGASISWNGDWRCPKTLRSPSQAGACRKRIPRRYRSGPASAVPLSWAPWARGITSWRSKLWSRCSTALQPRYLAWRPGVSRCSSTPARGDWDTRCAPTTCARWIESCRSTGSSCRIASWPVRRSIRLRGVRILVRCALRRTSHGRTARRLPIPSAECSSARSATPGV